MACKEDVYDAEISPLVRKIVEVCQEHDIAMFANFELGGDLNCTTVLRDENLKNKIADLGIIIRADQLTPGTPVREDPDGTVHFGQSPTRAYREAAHTRVIVNESGGPRELDICKCGMPWPCKQA